MMGRTSNSENQVNSTDQNHQAEALAAEIMELTRNTLLVKLRFLEPAIMSLGLIADPGASYATDGWSIYYGFLHVLRSYRIQREIVIHDYLHMILHLIFHHPFIGPGTDPVKWDLACDIAVEAVIDELAIPDAECVRSDQYRRIIEQFREGLPILTAERIYHYLGEQHIDETVMMSLRDLVCSDDHSLWYQHSKSEEKEDTISDEDENSGEDDDGSGESGGNDNQGNESDQAASGMDDESSDKQGADPQPVSGNDEAAANWKDISSRICTDLETESRYWAEKAGSLLRNIRERSRDRKNYRSFLEQFMSLGEVMKINDSEFDYIYYTYGLELYGNVPLVEPLEYLDEKRVRELAVVIDTSASISDDLIRQFLEKTLSILRDTDSFFTETGIRVILCDAGIQGDYPIHSAEDIESVMEKMALRGFGGTDFRPAFRYIDDMIAGGSFTELKGVLYFTDGFGIFPEWQPQYESAFVFIDDPLSPEDPEALHLPPWAMRLTLEPENIE